VSAVERTSARAAGRLDAPGRAAGPPGHPGRATPGWMPAASPAGPLGGPRRSARRAGVLVAGGLTVAALLTGCNGGDGGEAAPPAPTTTSASPGPPQTGPSRPAASTPPGRPGETRVLVTGLVAPWGLAFLPGGDALVTERDSARILRVTADGRATEVQRLSEVDGGGEGGLLGIAVSPGYARDSLVYVYYTTEQDNRIARLRLGERPDPIVTGIPVSGIHNGGRIAFGPDGMLYAGTGDASESGLSQDPRSLGGKVLRMRPDGSPAPGNPFPGSLVWSIGHRNVQGLAWDSDGRLWASEFGQNRFDEVNLVQRGRNYGWPIVEGRSDDSEFAQPIVIWTTAEASPSGAAIIGDRLYVAALRGQRLWRVPLDGRGGVGQPEALLEGEFGRLRHAAAAPDGTVWLLTSNRDGRGDPISDDDRIIRLTP
jgi:glucose/arabinose dehydrogenase